MSPENGKKSEQVIAAVGAAGAVSMAAIGGKKIGRRLAARKWSKDPVPASAKPAKAPRQLKAPKPVWNTPAAVTGAMNKAMKFRLRQMAERGKLVLLGEKKDKAKQGAMTAAGVGALLAGSGIAVAGIQSGRAAGQIRKTAAAGEVTAKAAAQAAAETAKAARSVRRIAATGGKIKKQLTTFPTVARLVGRRLAASGKVVHFGLRNQPREEKVKDRYRGRFVHPISGVVDNTADVSQVQVIKSAYRTGQQVNKYGGRAAGLAKDASDVISGKPRARDSRGLPKKREWEKSWFKNAVTAAATGAAVLGVAHGMKKSPKFRKQVQKAGDAVFTKTKGIVKPPSWARSQQFGSALHRLRVLEARMNGRQFDATAPDWDIRDQRGKSARVFAPGSRKRVRREKEWHERVDNQRKIAAVGAGLLAVGAAGAGYALGKRLAKKPVPFRPGVRKASTRRGNVFYPKTDKFKGSGNMPDQGKTGS